MRLEEDSIFIRILDISDYTSYVVSGWWCLVFTAAVWKMRMECADDAAIFIQTQPEYVVLNVPQPPCLEPEDISV